MTTFTINSRDHGVQEFSVPADGGFVRVNGVQICEGGRMRGETISASGASLETLARRWWKAHLSNMASA